MSKTLRSRFSKTLCTFLALSMITMGFPLNLFAADAVPAKIIFETQPKMYYKAGELVELKAYAVDKNGKKITKGCDMQYRAFNPVGDNTIAGGAPGRGKLLLKFGGDSAVAQIGSGSGIVRSSNARVEAYCRKQPKVKARKQFKTKGEAMTPQELAAEQAKLNTFYANGTIPPNVQFAGFQPIAPPAPVTPAPAVSGGAAAAGPDMTPLIIGLGVAGAVGVAVAVAAASSTTTTGGGSGCSAGKAPCGGYGVCCTDLYHYCPSNNVCYQTIFNACPGATTTCHN